MGKGPSQGRGRRGDSQVRGSDWIFVPRPSPRPAKMIAHQRVNRPSPSGPSLLIGSAFAAVTIISLAVTYVLAHATSAAETEVISEPLARYLLLLAIGAVTATTTGQMGPHFRRYGVHGNWREATAVYIVTLAGVILLVPVGVTLALDGWNGLNEAVAGLGATSNTAVSPLIGLSGALDGPALVAATATVLAAAPWLMAAGRDRLSAGGRVVILASLAMAVCIVRLIIERVTDSPTSLLTVVPPVDALILGMAVGAVPRSFVHRHPPRRAWPAAALMIPVALVLPQLMPQGTDSSTVSSTLSSSLGSTAVSAIAAMTAVAALIALLTADRIGLTPSLNSESGGRLSNHGASLVPSVIGWHSVTATVIFGRAVGNQLQGPWDALLTVSACLAVTLAAASITRSNLFDPVRAAMARSPLDYQAQFAILDCAHFQPAPNASWDEEHSRIVGSPLPTRPAVPIKTSKIVHRGQVPRSPHRGRRANRDQIPPPERRTRASLEITETAS